ncbi:tRNA (adenosine(37)-N6)-threonylcarbamoyltransferase complex transferase subunit TsaD [Romeria aff. gracilis LEGE 07310]|uniref:tRNA N6-adenosine threonylcarbamoyltransferase n=1 Tax=Vasconcelosia minhoensis LEGE 07310 TaxID=915328 RepID=A0A8J7AN41_9CYAN|nr:tRNA (adenosine(37)-N6)-threonylcarbamoyltransferase complex transferase subunit TsaD [Romeria gracilis]MBE9078045.1 tRNA (adenosine(37)-N6)-threonylcarbamoyltransferase complex transferase subunit TsaD [Romeria aff. gracilis LEGE 07310]
MPTILALETSCDETAAAIVRDRQVLGSIVASQLEIHQPYGGVVPEVAARAHVTAMGNAIAAVFTQANLDWADIDAVAATCAPGLVGALLVGVSAAKTLAMVRDKPFIGVHHLEGHLYAAYLSQPDLAPPFLCLLVSGGHTSLVQVRGCGDYTILGGTRDDAAGEAFDKVARQLDLGYPGGPAIDRLAQQGNPRAFDLPEGKISLPGGGFHPYDFSFSGIKTAVLRLTEKLRAEGRTLPTADIAASFQATVVGVLSKRAIACARDHQLNTLVLGGGVAANSGLRQQLQTEAADCGLRVIFPPLAYCTDNAAMIACAAADHWRQGHRSPLTLAGQSRLPVTAAMSFYLDKADRANEH